MPRQYSKDSSMSKVDKFDRQASVADRIMYQSEPDVGADSVKGDGSEHNRQTSKTPSDKNDDDSDDSDDSLYEESSEESDTWPPNPPVLRFKMRMQFSNRFVPP